MFERFREYGLTFKPRKCELFKTTIEVLGRTISESGIEMEDQYIKSVRNWPVPCNAKSVERFLGFANYYRSLYPISLALLPRCTQSPGKVVSDWRRNRVLSRVLALMIEPPVLNLPNKHGHFLLDTDASDCGRWRIESNSERGRENCRLWQCGAIVRAAQILHDAERAVGSCQVYSPVPPLLARSGVYGQNRPS